MNPDLAKERAVAQFNQKALTNYLYGGEKKVERKRIIAEFVETTPEFNDGAEPIFLGREERMENSIKKTMAIMNHIDKINIDDPGEVSYFRGLVLAGETSPAELHYVMFMPALRGQASDEQQEKWLPLALSRSIIGTYAQTELGHGTNLRNLETTATYDAKTGEFVINSPTLTSIKWWPGNLGKMSNYALVMAQLYTQGQRRGVHGFIVQLRDLKTHQPMHGITIGDIGPKFGMAANDNGFLRLDNVRVPRDHMLMRFAQVDADGTYTPARHNKVAYGTMIFVRALMVADQALGLARACTIATRYSCVRRQGEKYEGAGEVQLLDYQTQQYRLFPEIATAFAMYFAGLHIREVYEHISNQVQQGETGQLPHLHALSSGLKAVSSRAVAEGIEICRLSCGGHGYNQASGLPELYANLVGGCTYEGDNIVLLLQTARSLMKAVRSKSNGNNDGQQGVLAYLFQKGAPTKSTLDQRIRLEDVQAAYEHVARRLIREAAEMLSNYEAREYRAEEAWDRCAVQLTHCAKAHVRVYIVGNFIDAVKQAEKLGEPSVKRVMQLLCELYALCGITARSGSFLEDGYLSKQQMHYVRQRIVELLAEIRPMAVQIVDAFDFRDRELKSMLGRYDGNVYENMYKWARQSPLNKQEVLDPVKKYLLPMMTDARSKL